MKKEKHTNASTSHNKAIKQSGELIAFMERTKNKVLFKDKVAKAKLNIEKYGLPA
jgi:hypothetical protein